MNRIYKIIAYIAVPGVLSWITDGSGNTFFDNFNNIIIPLLATLLAINITTSSLIAGELRKIQLVNPECDLVDAKTEMKRIFKVQLCLILGLLFVFLIKDCSFIKNNINNQWVQIFVNGSVLAVFGYFLEIIYDLGCSLFDIINFNSEDKS